MSEATTDQELEAQELQDQELEDERDGMAEEIERLFQVLELAADPASRLMVYQWQRGKYVYLETLDPTESPSDLLDLIRREHGGGKFQVRVTDTANKYRGSRTVHIAGPERWQEEEEREPEERAAPREDPRLGRLERMIETLGERLLMMQTAPKENGSELLVQSMRSQSEMNQLLLTKILEDSRRDSGAELLEAFTKGLEMRGENGNGGGSKLDSVLAALVSRVPPGATPYGMQGAPAADSASSSPAAFDPVAELRGHLPMIRSAARVNLSPRTAAEMIASALEGSRLLAWALENAEELPQIIAQLDPTLGSRVQWLQEVRDELFPEGGPDE